jgi:beta-galactosidase/beta-glucuronidase
MDGGMKTLRMWGVLVVAVLIAQETPAQDPPGGWAIPAAAPLITSWGHTVSPANVLPEYPRPQLARSNWLNLNGLWQFRFARENEPPPVGKELKGTILVPFPVESALSGVMKSTDRLWYRKTFALPPAWSGKHILLHFGAVDWESVVYVNGKKAGTHRGGYDPFSFDITGVLKPGSTQELIVGVYDPSDSGDQARGKQVRKPESIWYTSSTGIWQTVWLEPVGDVSIEDLTITPSLKDSSITIVPELRGEGKDVTVRVAVSAEGDEVASATANAGSQIRLEIPRIHSWSPDDPFLYDVSIDLIRGGVKIDRVQSYFGMRSIAVGNDDRGRKRLLLNGSSVMQVGPLDQGFWPDGLYTAPTDEGLKSDILMIRKLGFNMARKHVKVEPERWYYWADRLGLLIWQDMPSANNKTEAGRKQFESELGRLVAAHKNHPSIVMWVVFNEGWGQYDTERLTAWVKHVDPTRLVNSASGWADKGSGDVTDIHSYPEPKSPKPDSVRAIVLGEFGGLGLAIPGHTWKKEHWGYKGMNDADELTAKYAEFLASVYRMNEEEGLSAAVYTQITDVEIECNGLLTYDRATVKPSIERTAAANRGK